MFRKINFLRFSDLRMSLYRWKNYVIDHAKNYNSYIGIFKLWNKNFVLEGYCFKQWILFFNFKFRFSNFIFALFFMMVRYVMISILLSKIVAFIRQDYFFLTCLLFNFLTRFLIAFGLIKKFLNKKFKQKRQKERLIIRLGNHGVFLIVPQM